MSECRIGRIVAYLLISVCIALADCPVSFSADMDRPEMEQRLKAAFLVNFLRFTYWPDAIETAEVPLNVVVSLDRKTGSIFEAISKADVRSHPIEVVFKRLDKIVPHRIHPDVIFITNTDIDSAMNVVAMFKNEPVLTVSDIKGFVKRGGMIELIRHDNAIHFLINYSAAQQVGLHMSAQMLRLADMVIENE